MRAIVQRVMKASVTVGDDLVSSIGQGLCVLIGISRDDTHADMEYIVRKLLNLRVFEDDKDKRWAKNVMDKNYEVLCVSQFTLYHVMKGNKPDFHCAMGGEESEKFYNTFLDQMKANYNPDKIKNGQFGAYMQVNIQNDGPVTLTLESPSQTPGKQTGPKERGAKAAEKAAKVAAMSAAAAEVAANNQSRTSDGISKNIEKVASDIEQVAKDMEDNLSTKS